ncbi:MAG: hypothetical protein BGN86_00310 [Caulobacterales bacterium 68-7]|nr:MAG: hypothetical protein BGN86_00310 [Caulobacterales bacterium 68-7]
MSKLKLRKSAPSLASRRKVDPTARAADQALFGPLDPSRPCGDCAACCVALGITEAPINKVPGEPCRFLSHQGCGIYQQRPDVCRHFQCLWKRSSVLPADARPDQSRVMFFFEGHKPPRFATEHAYIMALALDDGQSLDTDAFRSAVQGVIARYPHIPIWVSARDQKLCIYPRPKLLDVIEGRVNDPYLMGEALGWLETYVPLANEIAGDQSWFRDPAWRNRYAAPAAPTPSFLKGPLRFT